MSADVSVEAGRAPNPREAGRAPGPRVGRRLMTRCAIAGCGLLVVLAIAPVALVATASPAYAGGPEITGAGSSYAAVAIDQWAAEISSIDGDNINYSDSSSVIGLNEFAQEQVNFGASEIGYSTGQANYTPPAGYPYQYLPDVAGATCMMYNLQNPITGQPFSSLELTTQMILGIFTGTITTWGQLASGGLNPELQGDHNPIVVAWRTDASGENYILSDYLNTLDPTAWAQYTRTLNFPDGPQALWPFPQGSGSHPGYNFSNWDGQDGSNNASDYVYANPGSITYVETAYALEHHVPCAAVQNLPGDAFVQPSALADAEALLEAQLEPDLEQRLTNVFTDTNPKAYPISAYSYIITPEGQMNSAQGAVLGQFIEFFACQGQQSAQALGYSPLPPNLVNDDFQGIKRIHGAAAPPASVNATTCNDPYVSLFGPGGPPSGGGGGGSSSTGSSGASRPGGGTTNGGSSGTGTSGTKGSSPGSSGAGASGTSGTGGTTSTRGGTSGSNGGGTKSSGTGATSSGNGGTETTNPYQADPTVGLDLFAAAGKLLGIPRAVAPMVLVSLGLLLLIAAPPLLAWMRARRRSRMTQAG